MRIVVGKILRTLLFILLLPLIIMGLLLGMGKGVYELITKRNDETPLFPPPVEGERIEFDEDEQELIDVELRSWARSNDDFNRQVLEITGMDNSGSRGEFLDDSRTEDEMYHYIKGLKRAAYARYSYEEYSCAASTCYKALGVLHHFKVDNEYSGSGESEIWYLLAHMHACTQKFKIAQNMLVEAKKKVKHDRDSYLISMDWNLIVRVLELDIRSRSSPQPIENLGEAYFRAMTYQTS